MGPTGDDSHTTAIEAGASDYPHGAEIGAAAAVGGSRDADVHQGAFSGDLQLAEHPTQWLDNKYVTMDRGFAASMENKPSQMSLAASAPVSSSTTQMVRNRARVPSCTKRFQRR